MLEQILPPDLTPEEENTLLRTMLAAMMDRSERAQSSTRLPGQIQHGVAFEQQIRDRTRDLAQTLDKLRVTNARLSQAKRDAVDARNSLADALEAMAEGFAIFDASDRLTMWNSRFCADLPDVRRRIGPGLSFRDYVRIVSESPALSLHDAAARQDWIAQRLGSHRRQNVNFIVPLVEDQWLQVNEQRMRSGGIAVTQTDVTAMIRDERVERDKLLDEQAQMVRATLDHIDQGVAIFDSNARLAGWNRRLRELFAPPVDLLAIGTPLLQLLNDLGRRRQLGESDLREVLTEWQAGPPFRLPMRAEILPDDGRILQVSAQAMPDRGFVISFTDMTTERRAIAQMHRLNETLEARVQARTLQLEAARDAAERANASKSRFVASASHDLLQPLNAAKLFLAALRATEQGPTQQRLTDKITSAFGSVEQILGALLDISKFDIGAARAKVEPIALSSLLDRLREEFTPVAQGRGLDLRVMPCRISVMSDPVYLKRILQNLVSNAIRYTGSGRVVLGVRRERGRVRIEVWDTGPGIPEDKQTEIFKEFTRLDPAHSEAGMGLGLAIVEQACALLRHPLALHSTLGKGTMFSVSVPVCTTRRHVLAEPAGAELPLARLEDLLVLLVENDPEVRAGMMEILENWGTSPLEAVNLADARRHIAELGVPPDVILADYQLDHGETGLDLIRELRAEHGAIRAVLITANHSPDLAQAAEQDNVLLMTKPVSVRRLKRVLQQVPLDIDHRRDASGAAPEQGDLSYWLSAAQAED